MTKSYDNIQVRMSSENSETAMLSFTKTPPTVLGQNTNPNSTLGLSLPPSPVFANYKFQYSNMYIAQLTFTSLSQSYSCTGYIASTVHRLKQYSSEDLISWKDRVQTELAKLATIGKCRYRGVCKMGKNLFILTKASYRAPVACHLFRNVRNICIRILSQILSFWSWLYRVIFSLVKS